MKICKICLENDILCSSCNEKLQRNEISETDVVVSKALHKLEKEGNVSLDFIRAVDSGHLIIIADKKNARKLIGRGGKNARRLGEIIGKNVRIIENADIKEMVEKILNVHVIGVNVVYADEEICKIRIERSFQRRIRNESISLLNEIFDKKIELVFE